MLLLTIFLTLHFSSLRLFYFVTESFYLLISLTYFIQLSAHFPSDNHVITLCIYDCVCFLSYLFIYFVF